jgi:hypothetical protein
MTRKLEENRLIDESAAVETIQLWQQLINESKKRCRILAELTTYMTEIIKNHENK